MSFSVNDNVGTLHDKSDETILQTQKRGRKFSRDVLLHLQRQYQGESELPDLNKLKTFQKKPAKVKVSFFLLIIYNPFILFVIISVCLKQKTFGVVVNHL